ncbi:MAG: Imm64 family immunity protein [Herbinix sp.]|nr:Imm64 family immunity protein [Herbinix sp.]
MGSYITIGFIYNKFSMNNIKNQMERVVEYIVSSVGIIKKAKVSKDMDGEEWIEYDSINNSQIDTLFTSLAEHYYGQIEMETNLFDLKNLTIIMRVVKEENDDYFGLLLDVDENAFITNTVNVYTEKILNLITEFYNYSVYDYAFCDNEAEIKYSPKEFINLKESVYSLAILPVCNDISNKLRVIKSKWNIDGLTSRT